ncbi:MAG: hypothetical protein ACTHLK_21995 [Brucella intermedia]
MTITAQDLVRREVHYCVSSLVSTLAQGHGYMGRQGRFEHDEVVSLVDRAAELAAPVADYEEAAREAGWSVSRTQPGKISRKDEGVTSAVYMDSWEMACGYDDIEPHYREVYEHWIVSDWLADKLIEKGEKVDKDFAGLTIWARTTTGQAIYCDGVIEQITAELNAA